MFSSYKKIFLLGFIIVILIAIPFSIYIAQQRQNISSKATASTTLSFEPASATAKVGGTVTLNVMLDPGSGTSANQVSFVKLSIHFDQTKFTTVADSLTFNPTDNTLINVIDPAQYDNTAGTATLSLSIGADPTLAVKTKKKIAILKLKTTGETAPTIANVIFNPSPDTQILSIDNGSQTSDNVLSTTIPATVTVTAAAAAAATSSGLTCSSLNVDRSTTGNVPYSLTFTVNGNDSNGTINKVSLNFGDGPIQDITTGGGIGTNTVTNAQISHTYNNAGTYTVYAILTDNSNNLSTQQASCTKTITVNSAQTSGTGIAGPITTGTTGAVLTPIIITQTPQPLPTTIVLPPTGPGKKILGIGAIGAIFTLLGGALLIFL